MTGPATNQWDYTEITNKARDVLRLTTGDADAARLDDAARTACRLVDDEVDWETAGTPTETMVRPR